MPISSLTEFMKHGSLSKTGFMLKLTTLYFQKLTHFSWTTDVIYLQSRNVYHFHHNSPPGFLSGI